MTILIPSRFLRLSNIVRNFRPKGSLDWKTPEAGDCDLFAGIGRNIGTAVFNSLHLVSTTRVRQTGSLKIAARSMLMPVQRTRCAGVNTQDLGFSARKYGSTNQNSLMMICDNYLDIYRIQGRYGNIGEGR